MRATLPTADEVEVIARAIEGGMFDDEANDWCCGRSTRARKRGLPKWGRLVGHPLAWQDREHPYRPNAWDVVRLALRDRYAALLSERVDAVTRQMRKAMNFGFPGGLTSRPVTLAEWRARASKP